MSASNDFDNLLAWCCDAALDAGTALIEDDYWGFAATNARLNVTWHSWFPTFEEMLRYLSECWAFDYHADPHAVAEDGATPLRIARYSEYARQFAAGERDEADYLARLSEAHPDVTVHWIGILAELFEGETRYPCELRSLFRGTDFPEDCHPIADDELDDFLRYLAG